MGDTKDQDNETLDSYIRKVRDQEIKGILLKLKNEIRKPDASWETVESLLTSLRNKDKEVHAEVLPFISKQQQD
ncbi:MAG TPA: hypothetical protein VLB01_06470 [Thermodesulfobacteriota bacterium]|nr:hypothetical protein [Thermodesulfobacteriota bacterium]